MINHDNRNLKLSKRKKRHQTEDVSFKQGWRIYDTRTPNGIFIRSRRFPLFA